MQILRLPSFWLLFALLFLFLASPLLPADEVWTRIVFSLVLLAAVYVAHTRRAMLTAAAVLAAVWLVLSWANLGGALGRESLAANLVLLALLALTLGLVLVGLFSHCEVTADTLCGAGAVYLLIGTTWAVTYGVLERLQPGSFAGLSGGAGSDWVQLLYFSLVTLTTLGYGDITPNSEFAKIWSSLEAVTGTLYLTILVARLISLYRR